jgi:hypothetical protein
MTTKRFGRLVLALAALGTLPLAAFADEVVHFTNGAEMTVRSHTLEKEKQMVRLDLGANSFIAFPMAMVDKIESAGRDVFLNPVFHPSNQAIAAGAGGPVTDNSIHGTGEPNGLVRRPSKGTAGVMLGETADVLPVAAAGGQTVEQPIANSRRVFNPAMPSGPGAGPQVIMPPGKVMQPIQLAVIPSHPEPPPAPPATPEVQDNQPAGDPDPENPPDKQ